jgi:hypothetical protein
MKKLKSVKYFTISNVYVITIGIFTSFNQFGHGFNLIAKTLAKYFTFFVKFAQ